ncbi:MAG TPA: hypothetical protein VMV60_15190 [Thermoanaerobaculia bacterium]|nr:hypothetical protein [Thermoanaerobaculia bacterium]
MAIPPVSRVKVERSGRVLLDDRPVTLAALKKALPGLKKKKTRILYYREGSRTEASKLALAVFEVVMDSGLPVELCDDEAQFRGDRFGLPKEEKPDDDSWWG